MKKKLELQTIVVLLCALGIAGSWIGIQIARDTIGKWSEAHELWFTTGNLLGLGPRSELRCAGAVIGHVRAVKSGMGADGTPQFTIIAGVGRDFASWGFAPRGTVELGVVESALSPELDQPGLLEHARRGAAAETERGSAAGAATRP